MTITIHTTGGSPALGPAGTARSPATASSAPLRGGAGPAVADALTRGLTAISVGPARLPGCPASPALHSAVSKLRAGSAALAAGCNMADALGQILLLQSDGTSQRGMAAKDRVADQLQQRQQQNLREAKQIQRQIEGEGKSSFFDFLGKIFTAIGAAVGAVAGLASGNPLLLTGSALAIGGLATSCGSHKICKWLGFGLGLGGAAFSLGGGLTSVKPLFSPLDSAFIDIGSKVINANASAAAGVMAGGQGYHQSLADRAQAQVLQIRAFSEQLEQVAAQEREVLRTLSEVENRGVALVLGALANHDRAALAAVRGGR